MEVEALGKHPGETTALKVDLQERQQLTAHLLDVYVSINICSIHMLLSVKIIRLFGESKMALSIMFTTELLFYPAFCIHILHYAFYTHHHTHSIAYTIHSVLHVSDQK